MEMATESDLGMTEEDPPTAPAPPERPETVRLRGRLDHVMASLHTKLEKINTDSRVIRQGLSPRATRLACQAFSPDQLELEEEEARVPAGD